MTSTFRRIYRRLRFGRPVVVVSGLPRSGTSMAMRMLESGGLTVVGDGVRGADESNPNGYYELERVLGLDKGDDTAWLGEARGKAVKIVSALLPYLPEHYNYKVIFMHRDPSEVIASQKAMLMKRGEVADASEDEERLVRTYGAHVQKVKTLLGRRPCFDVIDVEYGDVLGQPLDQARRIDAFLGGGLDVSRMAAVVDAGLYRHRR